MPNAFTLYGENGHIFRSDGFGVIGVRNRKGASGKSTMPRSMEISCRPITPIVDVVLYSFIPRTCLATSRPENIGSLTDIRECRVTRQLYGDRLASRKLHDGVVWWRIIEIAMPPPFSESQSQEGLNRLCLVDALVICSAEAKHTFVPERDMASRQWNNCERQECVKE